MIRRVLLPPFWLILIFWSSRLQAQACTASFSYSQSAPGVYSFSSTSVPTTSASLYEWSFGDASPPLVTGSAVVAHSYSLAGTYTVNLWFRPVFPGPDSCQFSAIITVPPQPTCSIVLGSKASMPASACNGEAYISQITGLCGPGTITWSNGANTMSIGGLCPGIYSVQVASTFSGSCCQLLTGTVAVAGLNCAMSDQINHYTNNQGTVYFWHVVAGVNSSTNYNWDFGDGSAPVSGAGLYQIQHTYTVNGNYPVTCEVSTPPSACTVTTSKTVNVAGANMFPCQLNVAFTAINGPSGQVSFINQTTGTAASTKFTWDWGDQSPAGTGSSAVHQYSNNASYVVKLKADNLWVPGCVASNTLQVNVNNTFCFLNPSFSGTMAANGVMNLTAGGSSLSAFSWDLGDGATAAGALISHTYAVNGNYKVVLYETSGQCFAASQQQLVVSTAPCALKAGFTHTVVSGGKVQFSNLSTGIGSSSIFRWYFGNGTGSYLKDPEHTYSGNGMYYVSLLVIDSANSKCRDSVTMAINITGAGCSATADYKVFPGKSPGLWSLMPVDPWNVISARWDWGDGSSSNQLYASHLYTASGVYQVCLSVTVACGATASSCLTLSFTAQAPGGNNWQAVNIVVPELITGLRAVRQEIEPRVYPNPSAGLLMLEPGKPGKYQVMVYDVCGRAVYERELEQVGEEQEKMIIRLDRPGVYVMKILSGNSLFLKKLIVEGSR